MTRNRNLPAGVVPLDDGSGETTTGLTKREYAAIHIAAGIRASGKFLGPLSVALEAIQQANTLFDELEKGT